MEFDGREDSIYHPFDIAGNRHMEYVTYRGTFAEPPLADMIATFRARYPNWHSNASDPSGDFEAEAERETAKIET